MCRPSTRHECTHWVPFAVLYIQNMRSYGLPFAYIKKNMRLPTFIVHTNTCTNFQHGLTLIQDWIGLVIPNSTTWWRLRFSHSQQSSIEVWCTILNSNTKLTDYHWTPASLVYAASSLHLHLKYCHVALRPDMHDRKTYVTLKHTTASSAYMKPSRIISFHCAVYSDNKGIYSSVLLFYSLLCFAIVK